MVVTAKQSGNMSFDITQDGHTFIVDAKAEHGGENKGPSPKALLLSGLIGCTGMDVTSILRKMHQEYDSFNLEAESEYTDDHPKVFKDIKLRYIFEGSNLDSAKVTKAVKISEEKYCGVSAMLRVNRDIISEIIINGNKI